MRLVYIILLSLLNISCALAAPKDNLEKQYFEKFFNEAYISVEKSEKATSDKVRVTSGHTPKRKVTNNGKEQIISESIGFTVNIDIPSVEKILVLVSPINGKAISGADNYSTDTMLVGKYRFDPKINVSQIKGRLSLLLPSGKLQIKAWVRTEQGKYYFNTGTLYKMKWWE